MRRTLVLVGVAVLLMLAAAARAAADPGPPAPPPTPATTAPTTVPTTVPSVPATTVVPSPFAPPAATTPPDDVPDPPEPAAAGTGTDDLLRGPDLRKGQAPTFTEEYPSSGYTIDNTLGWRDVVDKWINEIAAGIFAVAIWIASAATKLFQWAFTVELFSFVGHAVSGIVGSLRDNVYGQFLGAFLILAGVYALWHGLVRRRATVAAEGWIWTLCALTAAGLFFARPASLVDSANHVSTGVSRAVLAGTSVIDSGQGPDDGATVQPTYSGDLATRELRVSADRFWRVYVFAPWQVMEFGSTRVGRTYGERVLRDKTLTAEESERVASDPAAAAALRDSKKADYNQVKAELQANEPDAWQWFQGHRAVPRVGVAVLALAAVVLAGVFLVALSAAVLLAQLAVLLLVLMAPLFLLASVQPGPGRVLAIRWIETLVGALMKRVVFSILLAVILVASGILLDSTYGLGWGMAMALQALVIIAAVVYRKPFARIFAHVGMPAVAGATHTVHDRATTRPMRTAARRVTQVGSRGAAIAATGGVSGAAEGAAVVASAGAYSASKGNGTGRRTGGRPLDAASEVSGNGKASPPDSTSAVRPNNTGEPLEPAEAAQRNQQRARSYLARGTGPSNGTNNGRAG